MTRAVATKEAVFAAASALVREGLTPSMTTVQERTGGSYTTVKKHLEAWEAENKAKLALVEVPPEIQAFGQELVQKLYSQATVAADARVAEPLAQAEAKRERAESQLAAAETEVARLEAVEQDQTAQIAKLGQRVHDLELEKAAQQATLAEKVAAVDRLEGLLAAAQKTLAERDIELAGLRASAKAVEALQGQMEALKSTVQQLGAAKGNKSP